jgi:peptidoglycan/xylan/chitin deacetylase (PgdA/CDA1 family)
MALRRRLGAAVRFSPARPALGLARRLARRTLLSRPLCGLASPLLEPHHGRGAALLYHRVHRDGAETAEWGNAGLSVSDHDFDLQIAWVARHCRCFALDEAIARLAAGRLPPDTVVVTFDDGYRDNLELALPVLEKHGVPATLFVATGLIDTAADPWWQELESLLARLDAVEVALERAEQPLRFRLRTQAQRSLAFDRLADYGRQATPARLQSLLDVLRQQASRRPGTPAATGAKAASAATPTAAATATAATTATTATTAPNPMLTWEELALLARHPLITIGAHTVSHPALRSLPDADARLEMERSRRALEDRAGATVSHFAYPFGGRAQVGPRESDLAAALGFRSAFTALEGHLHDQHAQSPFLLPRFPITRRDGIVGLRFKLSGWRALLQNRRQRLVTI